MTMRALLLSVLAATSLGGAAYAAANGPDEPHRRLVIGGDCVGCTFEDANLAGAQFLGGDFSEANFRNAELLGARLIDLTLAGAGLRDASLIEARLANVGLEGADLREARLDRSRLHQVRMIGANLHEATLDEAVLLMVDLNRANLSDASATEAVFRQSSFINAALSSADFDGAHFSGSQLTNVDARNASFNSAIFENVDLSGADLREAQFNDARFVAVNITEADFRGAQGLSARSFAHACGADVRGLPADVTVTGCSDRSASRRSDRVAVARASTEEMVLRQREARRAQIEQARTAFEQALSNIEIGVGGSDQARLEAIAAAREGWEAAAEALAEVEAELDGAASEMNWSFEIRRAELGEPIRVILEQAAPERVMITTPPPPPAPPAPKLPEPDIEPALAGEPETLEAPARPYEAPVSAADIAFLIDASAQDFFAEMSPTPTAFREVQAGVMRMDGASDRPLLCGEVEVVIDGADPQWASFATVRTSGYQTWIGAAASAVCEDPRTQMQPSADLAIRLEQRLTTLSGQ